MKYLSSLSASSSSSMTNLCPCAKRENTKARNYAPKSYLNQHWFLFSIISHAFNPTSPLGWGGLGLRLFQSSNWEGLPFPLPPSLGCGSRVSRVVVGSFFGARFEPPFFHHLGPPKIVITSYFGSKAIPFWGPKRGPKQAPTSELAFSLIFLGFLIFSIPPQVPPV